MAPHCYHFLVWQSLDFLDWVSWVIRWRGIWREPGIS